MKHINDSHAFKNYLLLYTGILFAIHLGVYGISFITGNDIYIFPLLFVKNNGILLMILSLPVTLSGDFIVVIIVLSFIFYFKKDIKLPWFKGFKDREIIKGRKIKLLVTATVMIIYSYLYTKFGTIFMIFSVNNGNFISYSLSSNALHLTSILILFLVAVSILSLTIRHFYNQFWIDILISFIQLAILFVIVKIPYEKYSIIRSGNNNSEQAKLSIITANYFTDNFINGFRILFIIISIITLISFIKKLINLFVRKIEKL
jgi:hypothetical protein